MIWPFKPKQAQPKAVVTVRASTKAQRSAQETYAATHSILAKEVGRPVPSHLEGRGRA